MWVRVYEQDVAQATDMSKQIHVVARRLTWHEHFAMCMFLGPRHVDVSFYIGQTVGIAQAITLLPRS